jgi:hypothetical protein
MTVSPLSVVVAAAWQGEPVVGVSDELLGQAWAVARPHLVQGWIACAYGDRLPAALRVEARHRRDRWESNLEHTARILKSARVTPVLIKSSLEERTEDDERPLASIEYGDIDLVVGGDGWARAISALQTWGAVEPASWLEPHKVMVRPTRGPAAHLHRDVEWFGIPAIGFEALRAAAHRSGDGLLLPSREIAILLLIGHAVFQTLELTLSDLVELRRLSGLEFEADAQRVACDWGWGDAFRFAMQRAEIAMTALDGGKRVALPVSLAGGQSLVDGWRHAAHLARSGLALTALREAVLRPCLVVAKTRTRRTLPLAA